MIELIFIRHGETDWSRSQNHSFRGRIDIPLNGNGINQAKTVGSRLKNENIAQIFSSPLKRAYDTAIEIAKLQGLPVNNHQGFIDLDFGDWQGQLHSEVKREFPKLFFKWHHAPHNMKFPNGESLDKVYCRIKKAITNLINNHEDEKLVIVTHGAVLRVVLCYLHGVGIEKYWQFTMENCAITRVRYLNSKFEIFAENDNQHLLV